MSGARLECLIKLFLCDVPATPKVDNPKGVIEIEVEAPLDQLNLGIFHLLLEVNLLTERLFDW